MKIKFKRITALFAALAIMITALPVSYTHLPHNLPNPHYPPRFS